MSESRDPLCRSCGKNRVPVVDLPQDKSLPPICVDCLRSGQAQTVLPRPAIDAERLNELEQSVAALASRVEVIERS